MPSRQLLGLFAFGKIVETVPSLLQRLRSEHAVRIDLQIEALIRRQIFGFLRRIGMGLENIDRPHQQPRHSEKYQRREQVQARRTDVAAAASGQVLARQESGARQQRENRAPEPAVECHIASSRFAQELAQRRQTQRRLLAARRAIRAVDRRAAVAAGLRCNILGSGFGPRRHSLRLALALKALVDPRQDAAQDVDFLLFQAGASEQPTQSRQQALRMRGPQKI